MRWPQVLVSYDCFLTWHPCAACPLCFAHPCACAVLPGSRVWLWCIPVACPAVFGCPWSITLYYFVIDSVHGLLGCPGFLLLKQCHSARPGVSPCRSRRLPPTALFPFSPTSAAAPCFYPHFQGRPRSAQESSGDSEEDWKEPQGWRTGILGFSPDLVTFLGFMYTRAIFPCGSKIIHAVCSAEQLGHIVGA